MNWIYSLLASMFNLNRTTGVVLPSDNKKTEHEKSEDRDLDKKRKHAIYSIYNYILTFKDSLQFDAEKSSKKLEYYSDMYDHETGAWIVFKLWKDDPIIKELKMFVSNNSVGNGFKSKRTGKYYRIYLNGHLISRDWFFDHKTYEHYQVFTDDMLEDIIKIFAERYKKLDDKYYSNEIHNFAF